FAFALGAGVLSVSPDGRRLAFVSESDKRRLWVRSLDSLVARQLPGTEDAFQPVWSPNSRSVAFETFGDPGRPGTTLKTIDTAGGQPVTLVNAVRATATRGAWGAQGVLLDKGPGGRLYRVSEAGGALTPVTELDPSRQETEHFWPIF